MPTVSSSKLPFFIYAFSAVPTEVQTDYASRRKRWTAKVACWMSLILNVASTKIKVKLVNYRIVIYTTRNFFFNGKYSQTDGPKKNKCKVPNDMVIPSTDLIHELRLFYCRVQWSGLLQMKQDLFLQVKENIGWLFSTWKKMAILLIKLIAIY